MPLVRAVEESGAWCVDTEGKQVRGRIVMGLALGMEQTVPRAASLCFWETRRVMGGRQDTNGRMTMGVEQNELVAHLCTLCQNVLSRDREPALGEKRHAQ